MNGAGCRDWYVETDCSNNENKLKKGKIVRGGSWDYGPVRCRVNGRFFRVETGRYNDCGFRLARNIPK